jgi:hypothetical protein
MSLAASRQNATTPTHDRELLAVMEVLRKHVTIFKMAPKVYTDNIIIL